MSRRKKLKLLIFVCCVTVAVSIIPLASLADENQGESTDPVVEETAFAEEDIIDDTESGETSETEATEATEETTTEEPTTGETTTEEPTTGETTTEEPTTGETTTEEPTTGETTTEDPTKETTTEEETTSEEESKEKETVSPFKKKNNAELIAAQNIKEIEPRELDFRFISVDANKYCFANDVDILDMAKTSGKAIGKAKKGNYCYVLSNEAGGWCFVESGKVRGFVRTWDIAGIPDDYYDIPDNEATMLVKISDNKAHSYIHVTANKALVEKKAKLAKKDCNIYEEKPSDYDPVMELDKIKDIRTIGTLSKNSICYLLEKGNDGWQYVESGDVRGFVFSGNLYSIEESAEIIGEADTEAFPVANEIVAPKENKNLYYTVTSVKDGDPESVYRYAVVAYAKQFVGNPYVWAHQDLVTGADCSGFTSSVYKYFGHMISGSDLDQSVTGTQISTDSIMPGDLVFYATNGQVHHVAMYAGDGMAVESHSTALGMIYHTMETYEFVWSTRQISDSPEASIYALSCFRSFAPQFTLSPSDFDYDPYESNGDEGIVKTLKTPEEK